MNDENSTGASSQPTASSGRVKAGVFIFFILAALVVFRYTPIRQYATAEALGNFLEAAGFWAPLVYMIVYMVGVCLFLPGTLLTGLGAAIFGPYKGFVYVWFGAMLGASLAFFIGRFLGREFAASLIGDRLKKYDDAIERNGFATVLYLRLVYFPFTPMNFGMGLTKVRFWDYLWGTGLGIVVGTFIFTFFVGTLKEVWVSGNWGRLISFKVFFSLGLFVFSLFIPKIVNIVKRRWRKNPEAGGDGPGQGTAINGRE
ncbi:MAG: TVP38/TMEM64 family protein [Desulfobacteraceae bacterium]|nr:TVP38/TMEM64 family protein [Desulfobacteraceae bacterium]